MAVKRDSFIISVIVLGCLIALYIAVFIPLLFTPFFPQSDDIWYILDNPQLKNFNFHNVLGQSYEGQYSPLNIFFLHLIQQVFGLNAFYYHLYSLVLHTGNAFLLYHILQKMVKTRQAGFFIPHIVTFLFLFHPLQIETVAWASASKWLLVTFCMLLSILFYLQYRIAHLIPCAFYSVVCFGLALLSKEIAVLLPVIITLFEIFFFKSKYHLLNGYSPFLPSH